MSADGGGGAYGAVPATGVGVGLWKDLAEAARVLRPETEAVPDPANQPGYRKSYNLYKGLYPALKPINDVGAKMGY